MANTVAMITKKKGLTSADVDAIIIILRQTDLGGQK
jgi:hypothetical protein